MAPLKLWSYRYADDLNLLLTRRRCIYTSSSGWYHHVPVAYDWMMEQMALRFKRPPWVKLPVWMWHRYDGKNKQPDMRRLKCRQAEQPMSLIACEIDEDRVLCSNEQSWHIVMNQGYISNDEEEDAWFNEQARHLTPSALDALKRQSWTRIFDLTGGDPAWWGDPAERDIQATTWYIRHDEIISTRLY